MIDWLKNYQAEQTRVMSSVPMDAVAGIADLMRKTRDGGGTIFLCGNGGSAANASHFAVDVGKGASLGRDTRFKIVSLNENIPWMTALGNDLAYDQIFVQQLKNFAQPGDLLLTMSVSGNSPNLVTTVEYANKAGVETIGLTGGKGGKLAELCKHVIKINSDHYGRVEDAHMFICHLLAYAFMENAVG